MSLSTLSMLASIAKIPTQAIIISPIDPPVLFWYDMSDTTTRLNLSGGQVLNNNAAVYKILDKSSNGYHLFNVGGGSSFHNVLLTGTWNGRDTVRTSGTSTTCGFFTLNTSPPMNNGFTVIMIYQAISGASGYNGLISKGNGNKPNPIDVYTTARFIGNGVSSGSVSSTLSTSSTTVINIVVMSWGGPTKTYNEFVNGVSVLSTTYSDPYYYGDSATLPMWLGTRADKVTYGYHNFGEVIGYNGTLTTEKRQQIEGYIAWKWGRQVVLPTGHPYRTGAPTTSGI